ncbi:MAG: phosphatase PAP2 family protein [Muribaculaceae bacterium]
MKLKFLILLFSLFVSLQSWANTDFETSSDSIATDTIAVAIIPADTISSEQLRSMLVAGATQFRADSVLDLPKEDYSQFTPWKEISFMGAPLIIAGFLVKSQKKDFRNIRHNFEPNFTNHLDDYIQYAPLAATFALKACGVRSRSGWGRLMVSSVFSSAIMAGAVNALKYSVKEMRPDGSTANSFPSGHTATAFMAATILHKEYGMTQSPLYSIGGYAVAAATGLMRMLNNRHWISDVLVGAGIGVFSVDLGYMFTDLIFKDKYLDKGLCSKANLSLKTNPSFVGLGISAGFLKNDIVLPYDEMFEVAPRLHLGTATSSFVEGAYFINPYIGFGGQLKATTLLVKISEDKFKLYEEMTVEYGFKAENMSMVTCDIGVYAQYPFLDNFSVGAKALVGRQYRADLNLTLDLGPDAADFDDSSMTYMKIDSQRSIKWATGVSCSYCYKNNFMVRFFVDYDWHRARFASETLEFEFTTDPITGDIDYHETFVPRGETKSNIGILSIGSTICVTF